MTTKIPAELSSTPGIADSSNATAITIDSSEEVGIGSTSPSAKLEVLGGSNSTYLKTGGDDSGTNARALTFTSASGTSLAGAVHIINAPSIQGQIAFQTNNGERARITGNGITFNGDTAAANALDDYEEGTWSPVYSSTGLSPTHDISNGYYTKIGNHVFFSMLIGTSAVSGTSGYQLTLTGLPYTSLNSAISMSSGSVGLAYKFVNNENGLKWFIGANTAYLRFYDGNSNTGAVTESNHLSTASTSNRMYIIGHYITA